MVQVKVPTPLRKYTGGAGGVEAQGATVAALVDDLERRYPGLKERICDESGQVRRAGRAPGVGPPQEGGASTPAAGPGSPLAVEVPHGRHTGQTALAAGAAFRRAKSSSKSASRAGMRNGCSTVSSTASSVL